MTQQSGLRVLAKAFASGQIKKDKYRTDRAAYLESVVADGLSLPLAEQIPREKSDKLSETFSDNTLRKSREYRAATTPTSEDAVGSSSFNLNKAMMVGGAALFVLIIVIVIAMSGGDDAPQPQTDQMDQPTAMTDGPPSAAQNLITGFLGDNIWSQSNLDLFAVEWQTIPLSVRTSAMSTTDFSRLVNAIYKKLLEERALSGISNPETSYEKQRLLVEFATTIGITDQRISLPEAPSSNELQTQSTESY